MYSIYKKELNRFFSNLTGYISIILFIIISGVYLFVLPGGSIFDNNYASLSAFFEIAPWVFLFLIPALTMHSFADEYKSGTYEILKTKPLTAWQIVIGKYAALLIILLLVIIPTGIYIICLHFLSANAGLDVGALVGSYTGLFLLTATYAAISLCCSGFTSNAVVAFLISATVCLLLYFGFNAISKIDFLVGNGDYFIEMLGIDFHYKSISRGVIDTRDVVYFFSMILFSLLLIVKKISTQ